MKYKNIKEIKHVTAKFITSVKFIAFMAFLINCLVYNQNNGFAKEIERIDRFKATSSEVVAASYNLDNNKDSNKDNNTENLIENYNKRNIKIIGKVYPISEIDFSNWIKNQDSLNLNNSTDSYNDYISKILEDSFVDKGITLAESHEDYSYSSKLNFNTVSKNNINKKDNISSINILNEFKINFASNIQKENSLVKNLIIFNPSKLSDVKILRDIILKLKSTGSKFTLISNGCSREYINNLNLNIPIYLIDETIIKTFKLKHSPAHILFNINKDEYTVKVFKTTN